MKAITPRRRWPLVASVFIVLLVVAGGAAALYRSMPQQVAKKVATTTTKVAPKMASAESKMLIMGDVFWGRYVNDWSQKSDLKYAYPFARLSEFNRENYDAWIADMECPITNNPKVSSATEDTTLQFDCSPNYLPYAKDYFTAFTLANNHTDNQNGVIGWKETIGHLRDNGIQSFGTFDPEDYSNVCNVLSLPARVTMDDETVKNVKLPTVWCGYHGVFKTPSATSLAVMQKYADRFNVVAMPHSGQEYKTAPDQIKTDLYRSMIDNGAEVVIGNHAHWVQTTESYKGHLIVHNLGNFIFDQQDTKEVTRSAVLQMTLSIDAKNAPDLDKWIALGEKCAEYNDTCLAQAEAQGLKKLPATFHFAALGSNDSGKQVKLATADELASLKQRLSWDNTIKGLSGNYSGE